MIARDITEQKNIQNELGDFAPIHRDNASYEAKGFDISKFSIQLSTVLYIQQSQKGGELVLEFSMADLIRYPYSCGLPKSKYMKIKINGNFILKRLIEIDIQYNVKVILAGDYGKETALSIFKRVIDAEQTRPDKEVA